MRELCELEPRLPSPQPSPASGRGGASIDSAPLLPHELDAPIARASSGCRVVAERPLRTVTCREKTIRFYALEDHVRAHRFRARLRELEVVGVGADVVRVARDFVLAGFEARHDRIEQCAAFP